MIPKISVCLIAKNEEKYIEKCLESVMPVASEIIVLDTGSTDRTREIVSKFPKARLYDGTWNDDFSEARNQSVAYAAGEWVLSVDADEVLTEDTQKKLLNLLNEKFSDFKPYIINFKIYNPQHNGTVSSFYRNTLFRNGFGIKFSGTVHERLVCPSEKPIYINCSELNIFHNGNLNEINLLNQKTENYIRLILKEINHGLDKERIPNYYFYLGKSYLNLGNFDKALKAFQQSEKFAEQLNLKKESTFYGNLYLKLGETLVFQKEYNQAVIILTELLVISPDFPDALFYLGYCFQNLGRFSESIPLYLKINNLLNNPDIFNPLNLSSVGDSIRGRLFFELGRCFMLNGSETEAMDYLHLSLKMVSPNDEILLHIVKYFSLKGDLGTANKYFFYNESKNNEIYKQLLEISKLPHESEIYKNTLLNLLVSLDTRKNWLIEEEETIKSKIIEIKSSLM